MLPLMGPALLVLAVVLYIRWGKRRKVASYDAAERARMPPELRTARLVLSEQTLWRKGSAALVGKFDQVFLTEDRWLVLVETKPWPEASHVIQLSAQAAILREHAARLGGRVAGWGYLRFRRDGQVRYQRVELIAPAEVEALRQHWWRLRAGKVAPEARPARHRCRNCGYAAGCEVRVRG